MGHPSHGGAITRCAAVPSPRPVPRRKRACGAASPDAAAGGQSRPGKDRSGSPLPLRRGGCGRRAPVGALPRPGRGRAVPASRVSESPSRFRFSKCRCAAPASARPVGAGSGDAPGASPAPALPPATRRRRCWAQNSLSPAAEPMMRVPRNRGVCGTFCKGSCWFDTASACSTHTAPLRAFPRRSKK